MTAYARDYVVTKPILVFVPYAVAGDLRTVVTWQSKLVPTGTRIRVEGDELHCKIAGAWQDVRLTLDPYDAGRREDRRTLDEMVDGGGLARSSVVGPASAAELPSLVATDLHTSLLRVDVSVEFSTLMETSESLRFAAEDYGVVVRAHDIGEDRTVGLSLASDAGELLFAIGCDTCGGTWDVWASDALVDPRLDACRNFSAEYLADACSLASQGLDLLLAHPCHDMAM